MQQQVRSILGKNCLRYKSSSSRITEAGTVSLGTDTYLFVLNIRHGGRLAKSSSLLVLTCELFVRHGVSVYLSSSVGCV